MNDTGNDVSFGAKLSVIFEIFTIFLLKGIKLPLLYLMNLATTSCLLECGNSFKQFQVTRRTVPNIMKKFKHVQPVKSVKERGRKETQCITH